jgi:hypothetical protein
MAAASPARADALFAKMGVGNYSRGLANVTASGFSWGATFYLEPISMLGFELSYEGSRNSFPDSSFEDTAILRNGGNAMLKLGIPLPVRPFIAAGIGGSFVTVTGARGNDYRGGFGKEFPLAAGIEFNPGPLTTGVRATLRYLMDPGATVFHDTTRLVDIAATIGVNL